MATLSQDDIKALEQTRLRLLPLYQSLTALQQNIVEQQPLPSWSVLWGFACPHTSNELY